MPSGRRRRSRRRAAASGSVEPPLGQHVPGRSLWAGASGGGGEGPLGQEVPGRSGLAAAGGSGSGDGPLGPELPGRKGSAVASGGGEGQLGHKGSTVIRLGSGSHQQPDLPSRQREEMFLGSDSSSESEPVIPITYTSSRGDELAGSAPSPSVCSGRERKRKRGMITTSSPHPNRSPSKPPLWDTSENKAAAEKSSDSSEYSSPIRRPKSLLVKKTTASGRVIYSQNSDQEVVAAYHRDYHKYQKKLARLQELPTLKPCKYGQNIIDCHDLDQKKAVIDVAGSVVTLSSYNGYTEINRCTGIIVEWIEVNRSAIVVTSSQIICTKISLDDWEDNNVYAPSAKVIAHLANGTTSVLSLLYFSKHYDIACFKITAESGLKVVSLDPKLEFGCKACVLVRDEEFGLICRRTEVKSIDPCGHQKNHWLFIGGQIPMGHWQNVDRNVVGMVISAVPNAAFIPSSTILNCLKLWKRFGHLARPHLGLKLKSVDFMDISYLQYLSHKLNINSGLIVTQVSAESPAEQNGIRLGEVILNCQGVAVSTISQLEGILLEICEKQFEISDNSSSKVDVELVDYNLRKNARRTITLSVNLSDCLEVFA